ncbi:calcium-binding protein [Pseudomonas subflava]|uniref:calcium-binding protein n=1 Tax=Pseudomonas subflava TaxID=2952933 RepID=UPI00207A0952|nr:calcium-binding protein [Pseudomonas subflava]
MRFHRELIQGTPGDDLLVSKPAPSRLVGGEGDDVLLAGPGSTSLDGGGGHNSLYGGPDVNYYVHHVENGGYDVIFNFGEPDSWEEVGDTLIVNAERESIHPIERMGHDLMIGIDGEPGRIVLKDFFLHSDFQLARFRFGTRYWDSEHMLEERFLVSRYGLPLAPPKPLPILYTGNLRRYDGTNGPDVLKVPRSVAAAHLSGHSGNDVLLGGSGGDLLNGGVSTPIFPGAASVDRLLGGLGDDYYQVDVVTGEDTSHQQIYDFDPSGPNLDTLHIRGGIGLASVRFNGGPPGDLVLELPNEQRIVITNYFLHESFLVEKIRFDDGTVLDEADVRELMGLPAREAPQVGLLTPAHSSVAEAQPPVSDGWLSLVLLAGAALTGG